MGKRFQKDGHWGTSSKRLGISLLVVQCQGKESPGFGLEAKEGFQPQIHPGGLLRASQAGCFTKKNTEVINHLRDDSWDYFKTLFEFEIRNSTHKDFFSTVGNSDRVDLALCHISNHWLDGSCSRAFGGTGWPLLPKCQGRCGLCPVCQRCPSAFGWRRHCRVHLLRKCFCRGGVSQEASNFQNWDIQTSTYFFLVKHQQEVHPVSFTSNFCQSVGLWELCGRVRSLERQQQRTAHAERRGGCEEWWQRSVEVWTVGGGEHCVIIYVILI